MVDEGGVGLSEDLPAEVDRGAPQRLGHLALDHVQHALVVVSASEFTRVIRLLGEPVAGARGTVKQLTPVCFFGEVGEVGANRGPHLFSRDLRSRRQSQGPVDLAVRPVHAPRSFPT